MNMITLELFKSELHNGKHEFSYYKKDGSLRKATGTLNLDLIPEDMHPKGINVDFNNSNIVRYFDFTVQGWRSVNVDNIVMFNYQSI